MVPSQILPTALNFSFKMQTTFFPDLAKSKVDRNHLKDFKINISPIFERDSDARLLALEITLQRFSKKVEKKQTPLSL